VLDLEAVERIGDEVAPGLSPEKVLQLLDLAEFSAAGVRLRRAAVLLLARDVSHWHPRCEVRILRVAGTELGTGRDYNVVTDKHVQGSIVELLTKAWDEIRPYLVETRLGPDGRFAEQVRYPEDACREALTNAIAHRDYSIEGRAIEVYVFDDRLEFRSPGALLSTVTIDGIRSLEGVHQSRNTVVARTLRELGYMREMGKGFRRIFQLMRAHDLVEPEIVADDQSFQVSLQHRSVFSDEDQRWIEAFEQFDLERDEAKVLLLGRDGDPLSVKQIMDATDLVDTEDYRVLIDRLLRKGLLRGVKQSRDRTRNSPRWKVVQPKDANRYYAELLQVARENLSDHKFERRDYTRMEERLSRDSPYKSGQGVGKHLQRLGLTDSAGYPTGRLKMLIESADNQGADKGSTKRGSPIPPGEPAARDRKAPAEGREPSAAVAPDELAEAEEVAARREPAKIFIGNLAYGASADEIRATFEGIGPVKAVSIPRDFQQAKLNRGYAFVEMERSEDAKAAKADLHGQTLAGRVMQLDWARS